MYMSLSSCIFAKIPTHSCRYLLLYLSLSSSIFAIIRTDSCRYLLLYLSLSFCIFAKIPYHTYVCIDPYPPVFCQKYIHIVADTCRHADRVFIPNQCGHQASSVSSAAAAAPPSAAAAAPPAGASSAAGNTSSDPSTSLNREATSAIPLDLASGVA